MFKWVSKALGQVSDSVGASFRNNLETLQHSWRKVDEEYGKLLEAPGGLDDPRLLEESKMSAHLNQLVQTVVNEETTESQDEHGQTGPCFEYMLQQNVIDKLCALGMPDRPPGMRSLITRTLDVIFANVKKPLLPNMSVHLAIRQFLTICVDKGDLRRKKAKKRFLSFLRTLCLNLRDDPSLAWVFFEEKKHGSDEADFLLFSALLSLLNDCDDDADAATEGLLCCVQLPDVRVAEYIATRTDFSRQLVLGLSKFYKGCPSTIDLEQIPVEAPPSSTGSHSALDAAAAEARAGRQREREEQRQRENSRRLSVSEELPRGADDPSAAKAFEYFFARLAVIDVVVMTTMPQVREQVCEMFRSEFLETDVRLALLSLEEAVAKWATVYLRKMVERLESPRLKRVICDFLLGVGGDNTANTVQSPADSTSDRQPLEPPPRSSSTSSASSNSAASLRSTFIKRIDALSEELNVATLGLVDCLLAQRDEHIVHSFVLQYIGGGEFLIPSARGIYLNLSTVETISSSTLLAPFKECKVDQDASLEDYLLDAQGDAQLWLEAFSRWECAGKLYEEHRIPQLANLEDPPEASNAPSEPSDEDELDKESSGSERKSEMSDAKSSDDFDEGLFLKTVYAKLATFFDNTFTANLRLTSLLARLCYCPHPLMHSYFLNPDLPVKPGVRLLTRALAKVWSEGRAKIVEMPDYEKRLASARARLNGDVSHTGDEESPDVEKFLRGMIVLEEFLKEMVAISDAKATLSKLSDLDRSKKRENIPGINQEDFID